MFVRSLDREASAPDIKTIGGPRSSGRPALRENIMRRTILLAVLLGLALAYPAIAQAQIVAKINLSNQRMNVYVDGIARYNWPVSTARPGYRTPTGTFRPTAVVRYHRSTIYSGSPMPYSIFFLRGYAIHGSYEIEISRPPRVPRLHQAAPVQRRRALFSRAAAWRREHADPDQQLNVIEGAATGN